MQKEIEELSEEDLMELWSAIGGTPHLYEYGKEDLKRTLITGETVSEEYEPNGLMLDYYTMAAIVHTLEKRGFPNGSSSPNSIEQEKYYVLYENDEGKSESTSFIASGLADCYNQIEAKFGSPVKQIIDIHSEPLK